MTLKSGDYPWCIVDAVSQAFVCMRCGKKHSFPYEGMSITEFCKKSEAFCELHKDCKEPKESDKTE